MSDNKKLFKNVKPDKTEYVVILKDSFGVAKRVEGLIYGDAMRKVVEWTTKFPTCVVQLFDKRVYKKTEEENEKC